MTERKKRRSKIDPVKVSILILSIFLVVYVSSKTYALATNVISYFLKSGYSNVGGAFTKPIFPEKAVLDKEVYDLRMHHLAHSFDLNNASSTALFKSATSTKMSTSTVNATTTKAMTTKLAPSLWPAKNTVYPKVGAILPFKRIVAYYGNLYSKKMGALGEYESEDMMRRLQAQAKEWELADPATPVVPALHYIAVVAQGSAGSDGMWRSRMPHTEIDKVIEMAKKIDAIVFLDVQVALSDLQKELPQLEKYLSMPNVHLGIDPEFSMKTGKKPGSVIGTMDAADINFAASYLAGLVQKHDLPPKVLTFYRFTRNMVTNYKNIKTIPEVQMVLTMDGWGHQARKIGTYKQFVYPEPIQFTGFKLFYKNDLKQENARLMTPAEVLKLTPAPIYIQYQ
ncbi:MAG: hypothetical protein QG568_246 [Patescibacteria group bacterium]|nr:hypothetical protein [Patescibacteria group bacterium]